MSNADNSYEGRTQRLRSRTLAAFRANNPTAPEAGRFIFDESTRVVRRMGQMRVVVQPAEGGTYTIPCCSCSAPIASSISISELQGIFPSYLGIYDTYFDISWNPFVGAISYSYTTTYPNQYIFEPTGPTSVRLYIIFNNYELFNITITGTNTCGSSSTTGIGFAPCFLAGSLVSLSDGTEKPIEDIAVGDYVIGAFGETNTVLALHRPLLGTARMCRINNEHSTSSHHPHISPDKRFFCAHPATVIGATYGREHDVINAEGKIEKRMLHGLNPGRIETLTTGQKLKTIEGSRMVETLEIYDMPPETQLYNLVIGGSHTYFVDGYAVTGWPREDDFDYDAWIPRTQNSS